MSALDPGGADNICCLQCPLIYRGHTSFYLYNMLVHSKILMYKFNMDASLISGKDPLTLYYFHVAVLIEPNDNVDSFPVVFSKQHYYATMNGSLNIATELFYFLEVLPWKLLLNNNLLGNFTFVILTGYSCQP